MSVVDTKIVTYEQAGVVKGQGELRSSLRWHNLRRLPILQFLVVGLFVITALCGEWIAPNDPYQTSLRARLLPPSWMEGGDARYILGTDRLGRDVLSRIIVGALPSFKVALAALVFGSVLGSFIGMIAGYIGGRVDAIIMRFADGTMAFPLILAALLLAAVIGPGGYTVVIAACIVLWARFARLIRSEVLSVKERDFVKLARIAGASNWRIMIDHILPNVLNSVMVLLTLQLGFVIILEATLSFLGAGIPPPTPTWGQMVADGRDHLEIAWWLSVFPGLAIAMVVLSFNLLGDWLRDHTDPRLR
ncbi:MAG: ABC transporter permease, partial [Deltaproteobacteria bacterium]|nr:ABC transporter permease [Deltaproteobacteria bacterium]